MQGFLTPTRPGNQTTDTDIFSLGSVLYAIVTGRWPCRDSGSFKSVDDMEIYSQKVNNLFRQGEFPDVKGLYGGGVMMRCWKHEYTSVDDILRDVEPEMLL
jgi:serine/threonine protein kinase